MPAATSYSTESELADFLTLELGPIGTALGWSGVASYAHPIALALRAYGVTAITDVTDAAAIEALAAREAWALAARHLAAKFDFSLDQQSFSRSQMQKMVLAALKQATAAALPYDTRRVAVSVGRIAHRDDPYGIPGDVLDALGVTP